MRLPVALLAVAVAVTALVACDGGDGRAGGGEGPSDGTRGAARPLPVLQPGEARAEGNQLLLGTPQGTTTFHAGVNLGATVPGTAPGELAIPRETYRRWFPQMVELGFQVVRVYTILPPAFYEELAAYNRGHPDRPLYFVQGVWIPEGQFLESRDLYDPAVVQGFRTEIGHAVEAVHGTLRRDPQPGQASGQWTADASPWLVSWLVGVEWDPEATYASDATNQGAAPFAGRFFVSSTDATPTESWLAGMLDHLATLEDARGRSLPLAFVNWATTDPLRHPEEPRPELEDLVGIDANHVRATEAWRGGTFASYHAYPYYPDFLRFEPGLQQHRWRGELDPYAGYLAALKAHHPDMAVLVTEFGVPSSVGTSHEGTRGRGQGDHSEQEAMQIDADLLRIIRDEGLSGGYVFAWADEWFKRTWNTQDLEVPEERRPLWQNAWTNEAHFGLVAMDAGGVAGTVVDGDDGEWERNGSRVIHEALDGVREVRATSDESYLYLRLRLDEAGLWQREPVTLGFDVVEGGAGGLPDRPGVDPGADVAVTIGPGDRAQAWVRASNDPFTHLYARFLGPPVRDAADATGAWHPMRLMTNRPMRIPTTGQTFPSEFFEVGALRSGTSDPADPAFDSRTAWSAEGQVIELRLPWAVLQVADPSSHLALRTAGAGDQAAVRPVPFERLGLTVVSGTRVQPTTGYGWEGWQSVRFGERMKAGVDTFRAAVQEVLQPRR